MLTVVKWLSFAASALRDRSVHEFKLSMPGNLRLPRGWGLLVSLQAARSGRVQESLRAYRQHGEPSTSPTAVRHVGHFWHLWHWSGLAGCLYALVAPAPLWAHSVGGTIVQLGVPAAALVQYCTSCHEGCPKSWQSLPLRSRRDVRLPQGLPGAPAAAAEAAQKASSTATTTEAALCLRPGGRALQRVES